MRAVTSLPLRHRLLYDPLFLDLSKRFRNGFFGKISGGGCSAVVSSSADFLQVCAFFILFFGVPGKSRSFADPSARLGRALFFFDGFAFSLDGVFVPAAVPIAAGVGLTGSVACALSLVEFRFGAERLAAYAPSENERHRLAFPEGDAAYYRRLDESAAAGHGLLSAERDAEATEYAANLFGSKFDAFPGDER